MELDSLHGKQAMANPHNLPVLGPRSDLERLGESFLQERQRMITNRLERIRQPRENSLAVVSNRGLLAMHQAPGPANLAAKAPADRLVSQANPQDGDRAGKAGDHLRGDPRPC